MNLKKTALPVAPLAIAAMLLTGCSGTGAESAKVDNTETAEGQGITVESCGRTLHLDKAPERVIFQNAVGAAQLADLGLLDKVIARTGQIDTSIYAPDAAKAIDEVPLLQGADSGHGHVKVSTEALLEQNPDLVIAYPSGVDLDKVDASGLPTYIPESYCPDREERPASFDDVTAEVERFGKLFGVEDRAEKLNEDLKSRVEDIEKKGGGELEGKTAAVLFITPGDTGTISVYGPPSMAQPQLDALGIKNVYADSKERVFDVSFEDVLEKNPDIIILLHTAGSPKEVMDTFKDIRGAAEMRASRENMVTTMSYPFVDPPSPLSIAGVENLRAQLLDGASGS